MKMRFRSRNYEPENGADEPENGADEPTTGARDVEHVLNVQELNRPDARESETETLMTVRDSSEARDPDSETLMTVRDSSEARDPDSETLMTVRDRPPDTQDPDAESSRCDSSASSSVETSLSDFSASSSVEASRCDFSASSFVEASLCDFSATTSAEASRCEFSTASSAEASRCEFSTASSAEGSTARLSVPSSPPAALSAALPQPDASPSGQTTHSRRSGALFVVLCPPDGGSWCWFTCFLAFAAAFVCDGIRLSLFLFDVRVGMADRVPSGTRTLEHMAVICLSRHAIEPFACAFINCYGFRHCLFVGSVLCVTWLTSICFFGNAHVFEHYQILAAVGGIGMGMINTSFVVLLSTLFVTNRQKAHLFLQLGSFTGMLLVPPFTEFAILTAGWQVALYFHLGLTCGTLGLWLLIVTPVPLKIDVIDRDPSAKVSCHRFTAMQQSAIARNAEISSENSRFPTILTAIGLAAFCSRLRMVTFTETTRVSDRCPWRTAASENGLPWLPEDGRQTCVRNVTNMFGVRLIGSRPMYRDDALFDGNVRSLAADLKLHQYAEYLMAMTRILSVNDLNEEKHNRCRVFPIAMSRVLKSMFRLDILCEPNFYLLACSEVLIHASSFVPFVFVKGAPGSGSSAEATLILVASRAGSLFGRGVGFALHETASSGAAVPLYHVGVTLIAAGPPLLLCASLVTFGAAVPLFAIFGALHGYYTSMRNATTYAVFPLAKHNGARGYVSIIRALSSFAGIKIATTIQMNDPTRNRDVYVFAATLMFAAGVCVTLLQLTTAKRATPNRHRFGRHRRAATE